MDLPESRNPSTLWQVRGSRGQWRSPKCVVDLKPTRSHRDRKEAEGTRLELDDVDLHVLQACQASHVDLVVGVSDVPHDGFFPRVQQSAGPDPTRTGCSKSGTDGQSATAGLLAPLRGRASEGRAPTPLLSNHTL